MNSSQQRILFIFYTIRNLFKINYLKEKIFNQVLGGIKKIP